MKRIANIIKDLFGILGTVLILGITICSAVKASAQDIYEIEQTFDQPFNQLYINQGWDARLIQAPEGSPTTVVLRTHCAEFFEEGNEPNIVEVKKLDKKSSWLYLNRNNIMPRTSVVEIHTAQPINEIHLYKDARLTIEQYDFDSVKLDIDVDTGALLVIDTMSCHNIAMISLHNATLDLRRGKINSLSIWAHDNSTVHKGKIWARNQRLHLSNKAVCNVTATDSVNHIYVDRKRWLNKADMFTRLSLDLGFNLSLPIMNTDGARQGSPYNTNFELGYFARFQTNDVPIKGRWHWNLGFQFGGQMKLLDNVVMADGKRLVLDDSYGATPPRQYLTHEYMGLPVSIKYIFDKRYAIFFKSAYATLMPMINFNQTLTTNTLTENNHWTRREEKGLDMLNHFNVRASIGLNAVLGGLGGIDFFIDLLPSYKASAGVPQTRMMGLVYHF